jgi:hypothetical protein
VRAVLVAFLGLASPLRRDRDAVPNSELQHGLCLQRRSEARWAYLRCDILSGLKLKLKRTCRLDLTGFQMGPRGRATVVCAGDTAVNTHARARATTGSKWSRGGFTCTSKKAGLRCRNPVATASSSAAPTRTASSPRTRGQVLRCGIPVPISSHVRAKSGTSAEMWQCKT